MTDEAPKRSALAEKIEALRAKSVQYIQTRKRVPQPLFWDAFGAQIRAIREEKEAERTLKELLED